MGNPVDTNLATLPGLGLDGHLHPNQYGTFEYPGNAKVLVCKQR
jgi:hypothetical protein